MWTVGSVVSSINLKNRTGIGGFWSRVFPLLFLGYALVANPLATQAGDLFTLNVEIRDARETRSFANAEEALRAIEEENLDRLFPDYQPTDPAVAMLDFRGLPMTARFAEGDDVLVFEVASLGIVESFGGPGLEVCRTLGWISLRIAG